MQRGFNFVEELIGRLRNKHAETAEASVTGAVKSHADYARLHGECNGLKHALNIVDELLREQKSEQ